MYIGPKSRTERPRKTKIGTEVAHVTVAVILSRGLFEDRPTEIGPY